MESQIKKADPKPDYASSMNWILVLPQNHIFEFGPPSEDVNYRDRTASIPDSVYVYRHPGVDASSNLEGLLISDVVAQLRLNKTTNQVFFKLSLKWFCRHRTQRPFSLNFQLTNTAGQRLAIVPIQPFIIDCQCTNPPNDIWSPPEVALGTPNDNYFTTVKTGELLLAEILPPDHGVVCG